jgi:hypothetical protein
MRTVEAKRRMCRTSTCDPEAAPRDGRDDFFCLRFAVWYPSIDCAYRTLYRTCPGCLDCEQGRFNLKRHRDSFRSGKRAVACGD